MRSFPEHFPIRYAILIVDHFNNSDEGYLGEAVSKVLWHKLIKLLQENPITLEFLRFNYRSVDLGFQQDRLGCIPELQASDNWYKEMSDKLKQIIPDYLYGNSYGLAYDIGIYSYEGMGEVPLFWQVLKHEKDKKYLENLIGRYHTNRMIFDSLAVWLKRAYPEIKQGNTAFFELQKTKKLYSSDITIPYSDLWAALDKGQNNGAIPVEAKTADIKLSPVIKEQLAIRPSKIKVRLFRNMMTLFTEEMLSLYGVATFCNNCYKMLPFGYKGKFCPVSEENKICYQERNRKRQRQHSQIAS